MSALSSRDIRVALEEGKRRTFAVALDWPGWARSGKGADAALEALALYAPRYRAVAAAAGHPFPGGSFAPGSLERAQLRVVERADGNATTDFGAPAVQFVADCEPMVGDEISKTTAILQASWDHLASIVADAPAELRKGPRGGGRDRDQIVEHVVAAEVEYARKLGVPRRKVPPGDRKAARLLRDEILAALTAAASSEEPATSWKPRYAARRLTWHVLDHAFEIEDKSD